MLPFGVTCRTLVLLFMNTNWQDLQISIISKHFLNTCLFLTLPGRSETAVKIQNCFVVVWRVLPASVSCLNVLENYCWVGGSRSEVFGSRNSTGTFAGCWRNKQGSEMSSRREIKRAKHRKNVSVWKLLQQLLTAYLWAKTPWPHTDLFLSVLSEKLLSVSWRMHMKASSINRRVCCGCSALNGFQHIKH